MSFTDQKPFIATEEDINLNWGARPNGERFICGFCGYKFKVGDTVRWVFTNDTPGAGGNPFVCQSCDNPSREILLNKRKKMFENYYILKRF